MKINLCGQRFGRLLVQSEAQRNKRGQSRWNCLCDCGNNTTILGFNLGRGNTKSCGCLHREIMTKHGAAGHTWHSWSPEYQAWKAMKNRCLNKNTSFYRHYGGRGIQVCTEWLEDFPAFLRHVGFKPTTKHSLDRINNNGNYEPGNVRWATQKEQCSNSRRWK